MPTLYFIGNKYVNRKLKKGVVIPCHEYLCTWWGYACALCI